MSDDVYRKLQKHLHQHPMGFPATESGVEIKLLKKLFESEEAKIALGIIPKPNSAEEIAVKFGYDPKVMAEKLDRMASRGLILRKRKGDRILFNLEPYVVGIYEFQIANLDKEFIKLVKNYPELGGEIFGSETPYFRVVPVQRSIQTEIEIFPYEKVSELIDKAEKIAVTDCICRTREKMDGAGCDRTVQNCLIFSPHAEYYIENVFPGRYVSKEEALDILTQADEEGLVHNTQNVASGSFFICNCCSCCCSILNAVKTFNLHDRVGRSCYYAEVNENTCAGCEECIVRCPFHAISIENNVAKINLSFCMGCGLCSSTCSTGALSLARKPDDQIIQPPPDLETMYEQIGKEKGGRMKVVA